MAAGRHRRRLFLTILIRSPAPIQKRMRSLYNEVRDSYYSKRKMSKRWPVRTCEPAIVTGVIVAISCLKEQNALEAYNTVNIETYITVSVSERAMRTLIRTKQAARFSADIRRHTTYFAFAFCRLAASFRENYP